MEEKELSPVEKAFKNHVIVDTILRHLPFMDMLKMRQINWFCKSVGDQTIAKLECRAVFSNLFYKYIFYKKNPVIEFDGVHLENYAAKVAKEEWTLPFKSYTLNTKGFFFNIDKMAQIYNKLRHAIANEAKHLEISQNSWTIFIFPVSYCYPQLKSVSIRIYGDSYEYTSHDEFAKYISIVDSCPCIQKLSLFVKIVDNSRTLTLFLKRLSECQNVCKITQLDLGGFIVDEHWNLLANTGVRLRELEATFTRGTYFTSESFITFLSSQSETLEELTINCKGVGTVLRLAFPKVKNLRFLRINIEDSRLATANSNVQLPDLCFATQFPKLEQLELTGRWPDGYDTAFMKCLPTLQYLELPEHASISDALRIFPNIIELRCCVMDLISINELNKLSKIKKLTLTGSRFAEADRDCLAYEDFLQGVQKDAAFFGNIKILTFVKIKLTNKMVLSTVVNIVTLESLDIRECPLHDVSTECAERLKKYLKVHSNPEKLKPQPLTLEEEYLLNEIKTQGQRP